MRVVGMHRDTVLWWRRGVEARRGVGTQSAGLFVLGPSRLRGQHLSQYLCKVHTHTLQLWAFEKPDGEFLNCRKSSIVREAVQIPAYVASPWEQNLLPSHSKNRDSEQAPAMGFPWHMRHGHALLQVRPHNADRVVGGHCSAAVVLYPCLAAELRPDSCATMRLSKCSRIRTTDRPAGRRVRPDGVPIATTSTRWLCPKMGSSHPSTISAFRDVRLECSAPYPRA